MADFKENRPNRTRRPRIVHIAPGAEKVDCIALDAGGGTAGQPGRPISILAATNTEQIPNRKKVGSDELPDFSVNILASRGYRGVE